MSGRSHPCIVTRLPALAWVTNGGMDNITHSLFALTLSRTALGRSTRGATVALVLASNVPDVDIVSTAMGATKYLGWHRGLSHGPVGIAGLGLLTAGLVWAAQLLMGRNGADRGASFPTLAGVSILGALLHVLMDLPTSYGVRLLSPFDWHWFTTDWMPIVDIYLLVALAAGLYFGRSSEAACRRNVIIVLLLMSANYGVRAAAHHRALTLAPRLFGPTLPEACEGGVVERAIAARWPRDQAPRLPDPGAVRCLIEMAALPSFTSPFEWRVLVQTSNSYEFQDVNVLSRRFLAPASEPEVLWRLSSRYPNQWTPAAVAAASSQVGRVFLGFSRFPAARSFGDPGGESTVQFSDVRFNVTGPLRPGSGGGRAGTARGRGSPPPPPSIFTATIRLDANGRVISERLGP